MGKRLVKFNNVVPVVFSLTTHLVAATMSGKEGAIDSSSSRAAQQAHE